MLIMMNTISIHTYNKYIKITSKLYISDKCKEVEKLDNECSNRKDDTCEHNVYMNNIHIKMKKSNIYFFLSRKIKYNNLKIKHTYLSHFLKDDKIPNDYHIDNDGYVYYKKENIEYINGSEYTVITPCIKISTTCKQSSPCKHDVCINNESKLMSSYDIYKLIIDLIKNKNLKIKESYLKHFINSVNNRLFYSNKKIYIDLQKLKINIDYCVDENGYIYYN
jgi:hypothetical protein